MSRTGHPLPQSEEARRNEVPETLEARKGEGSDGAAAVQATQPVAPDGEPYEAADLGRGPTTHQQELKEDQSEHQDRGQRFIDDDGDIDSGAVTEGQQP